MRLFKYVVLPGALLEATAWVVSWLSRPGMCGELLFRHMADGQGHPEVPVWQTFSIMDQQSQPQLSSLVPRIRDGIQGFIHSTTKVLHSYVLSCLVQKCISLSFPVALRVNSGLVLVKQAPYKLATIPARQSPCLNDSSSS